MLPARMLLDLLKAPGLCMVCYGNVSSMRHLYGKSFDNTRHPVPRFTGKTAEISERPPKYRKDQRIIGKH